MEVLGDVMPTPLHGVEPERRQPLADPCDQLAGVGDEDEELGRVVEQRPLLRFEASSLGLLVHGAERPSWAVGPAVDP